MENKKGVGVRKGAWTKEEDILLRNCINKFGIGRWHLVPLRAGLNRCRKSCRLRWLNYLRPDLKRGYFSKDEVDLLVRLHKLLGNKWSLIAGRLPGRTANDVKNFWNTHMFKKPQSSGDKRRGKTITHSNIVIRPKPRILTKSQPPAWLSLVARSKPLRNDEENEAPTKEQASVPSSSLSSLAKANDRNENIIPIDASLEDDLDDCVKWWGNLLQMTEDDDGKETPFSVSGNEQGITAPVFVEDQVWNWDSANHEGLELQQFIEDQ